MPHSTPQLFFTKNLFSGSQPTIVTLCSVVLLSVMKVPSAQNIRFLLQIMALRARVWSWKATSLQSPYKMRMLLRMNILLFMQVVFEVMARLHEGTTPFVRVCSSVGQRELGPIAKLPIYQKTPEGYPPRHPAKLNWLEHANTSCIDISTTSTLYILCVIYTASKADKICEIVHCPSLTTCDALHLQSIVILGKVGKGFWFGRAIPADSRGKLSPGSYFMYWPLNQRGGILVKGLRPILQVRSDF